MNVETEPRFKMGDNVIISDEVGKLGQGPITSIRYTWGMDFYEYHVWITSPDTQNWFTEDQIELKK